MSEVKQITLSGIIALLDQGLGKKEIAHHYGISTTEVNKLFNLPQLKGRRPAKKLSFKIVLDVDVDKDGNPVNMDDVDVPATVQNAIVEPGNTESDPTLDAEMQDNAEGTFDPNDNEEYASMSSGTIVISNE